MCSKTKYLPPHFLDQLKKRQRGGECEGEGTEGMGWFLDAVIFLTIPTGKAQDCLTAERRGPW